MKYSKRLNKIRQVLLPNGSGYHQYVLVFHPDVTKMLYISNSKMPHLKVVHFFSYHHAPASNHNLIPLARDMPNRRRSSSKHELCLL